MGLHIGGLDEFCDNVAARFAQEGYVVIIPDLLHRLPAEALDGSHLARLDWLNDTEIVSDVRTAVDYIRGHPRVRPDQVGFVGYCFGGRVAWLAAEHVTDLKFSVCYYGGHVAKPFGKSNFGRSPLEMADLISVPMLLHYGEQDQNPSPADRLKQTASLSRLQKAHDVVVYPDAGHAFMDFTRPHYFRAAAAEQSWQPTLDFVGKHIR
jgi:carboxymethylenebutenolidase